MKKYIFSLLLIGICAINVNAQVIKGTYAIKNAATGMLLRIRDANTANGTPVVGYNPVNWKCMTWDFQHTDGNTYQLRNLFSGKTLQPQQTPAENATMEEQPLVNNAPGQQYEFIPATKDNYFIRLKGTDLYLSLANNTGATNTPVILVTKKESLLQQWTIYEQHPTM